jgi:acetyl-CoA acyltransferase 1
MDPNQSFKTEINDDRPSATVIPSSLTPPPSSQVAAGAHAASRRNTLYSHSQHTAPFSPPATVLNTGRERDVGADFVPPEAEQIRGASAEQLRGMLQSCIAEHQKLKMETAHHKLQFNLLSLQADEESKRAAVEHDMIRREVDALRTAGHSRQARRDLDSSSDSMQAKYLQMKSWYEAAVDENETLDRRLRVAKKVIQQKEEETVSLAEEREMLLNRIRENREHFHMLCSPGGIFHGILTPTKQQHQQNLLSTPVQQQQQQHRQHTPRGGNDGQHGLSMILQAMSQDSHNNSAPSTPITQTARSTARHETRRHSRNAQSMSSLPTTPVNKPRDRSALLPSADLVPQTEPRMMYSQRYFEPETPKGRVQRRRKSRESTISADEEGEAARRGQPTSSMRSQAETELYDSQASQAATEMLRRHPGQSMVVNSSSGSREESPVRAEGVKPRAKLPEFSRSEKRKLSGAGNGGEGGSPPKRTRVGNEERRVGLGIQFGGR